MLSNLNLDTLRTSLLISTSLEDENMMLLERAQTLLMISLLENESPEKIAAHRERAANVYRKMGIAIPERAVQEEV